MRRRRPGVAGVAKYERELIGARFNPGGIEGCYVRPEGRKAFPSSRPLLSAIRTTQLVRLGYLCLINYIIEGLL